MKILDSKIIPPGARFFLRILDRLFAYETMSGAGACPVYLERWVCAEVFQCGVYLHHFIGDDWAIDPHDHPRRFVSIGLKGWYWEDVFGPACLLDPGRDVLRAGDEFALPHDAEQWYTLGDLAPEETFKSGLLYRRPGGKTTTRYRAPWCRSFPAEHLHRVRASECGDCWTLVIVLPKTRRWGFVKDGKWIGFREYVFGGHSRKSC